MTSLPLVAWWDQGQGGSAESVGDRGLLMLANLLRMPASRFHELYFLRKPLLSRRGEFEDLTPDHPARMMSLSDVRTLLRRQLPRPARFLHDVDVTRYVDGRRSSLSPTDGAVNAEAVWAAFTSGGYSIRLVHPQQWHQACFELCSCLQEHFGHPVGCSAYLTPPASQGFPPHYDDVEVFVLQLEGSKRWRLYSRPDEQTRPAADVTTEFTQAQLGEPIDQFTLHPGDLVYLPRGVVHQALTQEGTHSLHLTFSTYQRHTWRDMLAEADSLPLSNRARAALAALRAGGGPAASGTGAVVGTGDAFQKRNRASKSGTGADVGAWDAGAVLLGTGLLGTLPMDLLATPCAGTPTAGWVHHAACLVPPHVPFWLSQELWTDGTLGKAIDAHALRYLQNSLPPLDDRAGRRGHRGGAGANGEAGEGGDEGEEGAAAPIEDATRLRLRAPHCARLVDSAETGGSFDEWECGRGLPPALALHTNVLNARALSEPCGPAFEVLPSLGRSVLQLLTAGAAGIRVGELHASQRGSARDARLGAAAAEERHADLLDLLEALVEHGVLVRHRSVGGDGACDDAAGGDDAGRGEEQVGEEEEGKAREDDDDDDDDDDGAARELTVDADGRTLLGRGGEGGGDDDDESSGGAAMDYSTRVWRELVPRRSISRLAADCAAAYLKVKTTTRRLGLAYETNATYWIGADTSATSALERLVLDIFGRHTRGVHYDAARSGAEWWTQVVDARHDIPFHWDRDYELHREDGVCLHPHLATVTYLTGHGGAPTVVLPVASPVAASEVAGTCRGPIRRVHACYPTEGSHLAFDGRLLHGAPAELAAPPPPRATRPGPGGKRARMGETSGEDTTAVPGAPAAKRITLLVNIWLNWVPSGADPLHDQVALALSTKPIALSWQQPCSPSTHQLGRAGRPLPPREWTFTGFGEDAASEGRLKLTLPDWSGAVRTQGDELVAIQFARLSGQLEHNSDC